MDPAADVTKYWSRALKLDTATGMLKNAPYSEIYREGDWCIVDMGDARGAWIVHYCFDQIYNNRTWNFVRSSYNSLSYYEAGSHYTCSTCDKTAPESTITLLELYR